MRGQVGFQVVGQRVHIDQIAAEAAHKLIRKGCEELRALYLRRRGKVGEGDLLFDCGDDLILNGLIVLLLFCSIRIRALLLLRVALLRHLRDHARHKRDQILNRDGFQAGQRLCRRLVAREDVENAVLDALQLFGDVGAEEFFKAGSCQQRVETFAEHGADDRFYDAGKGIFFIHAVCVKVLREAKLLLQIGEEAGNRVFDEGDEDVRIRHGGGRRNLGGLDLFLHEGGYVDVVTVHEAIADISAVLIGYDVDGNRHAHADLALRGGSVGRDLRADQAEALYIDFALPHGVSGGIDFIRAVRFDRYAVIQIGAAVVAHDVEREACGYADAALAGLRRLSVIILFAKRV